MRDFLGRANISGFDADSYFNSNGGNTSNLPNIAIAVSGGGYRALMNGAGAIQAFDSREANSTASGHLGGLLQSSTYVAGLSGGSWLLGSIFVNNFTTISNLMSDSGSTWNFEQTIFEGPDRGIQILSTADYYSTIYDEVQDKTKVYNTTITDYWGRALSFQMFNASNGGPSLTWSSIALQDGFSTGQQPFPIVVADSRRPNELVVAGNSSIIEFHPDEMGTWDPTIYGFAPLEYIGGNFSNGTVPEDQKCVRGFDNAGFVIGTSSSLFNQFLLQTLGASNASTATGAPQFLINALLDIAGNVAEGGDDIASYGPQPFYGWNPTGHNEVVDYPELTLVDGGTDGQNIPLQPLIQPNRHVDVIFAVDSSADTDHNWPNGTSLVATYERSQNLSGIANGTSFPAVPDQNTFVNLGLNSRPAFFGCNASNTTTETPLIVYLPNSPYTFFSNWSTFEPQYNESARDATVLNGYYAATQANSTADPEWPACVACAILSRSFDRTRTSVPSQCQSCFSRYCWNGNLASNSPAEYAPGLANATAKSGAMSVAKAGSVFPAVVAATVALIFFL